VPGPTDPIRDGNARPRAPWSVDGGDGREMAGTSGSTAGPLRLIDEIPDIRTLEPLDSYHAELVALSRLLLADGVDPLGITRTLGQLNDTLTARLIGLAEAELGPAPCRHAWLSLGSQGRGEQVLSSDQDSALVYEAAGTGQHDFRDYYGPLAGLVVDALARAGSPLCSGGYMATTWCRPIEEFRGLLRGWVDVPEPQALLRAEVFLDLRPVDGDLPVDLLYAVLASGELRPRFLVMLAGAAVTFRPPIGLFGRLRVEGSVDVKRAGIAAIVLLARLYALAAGSPARSTALRLAAAADAGWISRPRAATLTEAYRFLTGLRLRHQIEQAGRGEPADNMVPLAALTRSEQQQLREVLRAVRDLQGMTAVRFATDTVI
jgi:CBS domain-containing protein